MIKRTVTIRGREEDVNTVLRSIRKERNIL